MSDELQLFDIGGPIRTRARARTSHASGRCVYPGCDRERRHSRGAQHCAEHDPAVRVCREPGCSNPRRQAQAAVYCDEHTRSRDGARTEQASCLRCSATFERRCLNPNHTGATLAWRDFCLRCRDASPLTFNQLAKHHVPAAIARAWLATELRCDLCRKPLRRNMSPPIVDHDHTCCPGKRSCGLCVRGVICTGCNTAVAMVERLRRDGVTETRVVEYLRPRGRG